MMCNLHNAGVTLREWREDILGQDLHFVSSDDDEVQTNFQGLI